MSPNSTESNFQECIERHLSLKSLTTLFISWQNAFPYLTDSHNQTNFLTHY